MSRSKHIRTVGLILLVCVTLAAGSWLATESSRAQSESRLADLALQPQDVSKDAQWLGASTVDATDVSQPLNRVNVESLSSTPPLDAASVLAYESAYKVEAVELDENGSGLATIGHYLYRYPEKTQAQAASEAIFNTMAQVTHGDILDNGAATEENGYVGRTLKVSNPEEGTVVNWFVGVNGRTLNLLMVEGLPLPSTQALFDGLVNRVLSHQDS